MKTLIVGLGLVALSGCTHGVSASSAPSPSFVLESPDDPGTKIVGGTQAGAEAFVRQFEVAEHQAYLAADFKVLDAMTSDDCPCRQSFAAITDTLAKVHGRVKPYSQTIESVTASHDSGDDWTVIATVSHGAYDIVGSAGAVIYPRPAAQSQAITFKVSWKGPKWLVTDIQAAS